MTMQHPRRDQLGTTPRGGRGSLRRVGPAMMDVKYRFRKGEVAKPTTKNRPAASHTNPTGRLLLNKLHPRLKTDILRTDSANPESKVRTVERLVVFCFRDGPSISRDENESMTVLNRVLVAPPWSPLPRMSSSQRQKIGSCLMTRHRTPDFTTIPAAVRSIACNCTGFGNSTG
mmetsp:Transcript_48546/g.58577  ORF Transcript_48546/g.58577 Transcript_48546/m.58577 type:complete len:173 (+) Transcript_48546:164-682(+)